MKNGAEGGGPRLGPTRALVLASLALSAQPAALSAQVGREEVRSVQFEGNATFPPDSLARAIVTQETDCRSFWLVPFCAVGMEFAQRRSDLRQQELQRDRARLTVWYYTRGFRDVQVDSPTVAQTPTGGVEVSFRVREGRPTLASLVAFEGVESFLGTGLLDRLPLRQGDRLDAHALNATRDTLSQRLENQGHAHVEVFLRSLRPADDPYNASVTFEIVPGARATYGAIDIQGIEELSQGTIRRTLPFRSGGVYRARDMEDARARLFGLDIVRSAQVAPDLEAAPDSVVPVSVLVQEGDAYRVRGGVGWSTAECLNLEARWTSRNFFGGGRLFQVRGRVGNLLAAQAPVLCDDSGSGEFARLTWVASVDLAQPWIFSTDNSLATSIFAERQTLPDIFVRRAIGFQAAITRRVDARTTLTGFFRPELSELDADDVLFCSGFLVCTPEDILLLEGANWLAPLGLSLARDESDDLLNPRNGYRVSFDLEHAAGWTGSEFRYDRAVAEATLYEEVVAPVVFATRVRAGWVGSGSYAALGQRAEDVSIVHPQRRFYAGGASSVRGYPQSRLGPRVLFTDVRPLLIVDGGAGCTPAEVMDLSCDAGVGGDSIAFSALPTGGTRVFEGNAELRFPLGSWLEGVAFTDFGQAWGADDSVDLADIRVTPGFGVRFPSPVGPIRIDLAFSPRGERELAVITRQLRAYDPALDADEDRLTVDGTTIPFVQTTQLALLSPLVLYRESDSRLQLHVSIGQAF